MAQRQLREALRAYRIGDPSGAHEIYSGEGAKKYPGRWNVNGQALIYSAEYYSTAMLEKLVYTGELPPNQHFIEIDIPAGVSYEVVTKDSLKGWSEHNGAASKAFGGRWLAEARTAILIVPSVVARMERNILINPQHPEAMRIRPGLEQPVWWDKRLFGEAS